MPGLKTDKVEIVDGGVLVKGGSVSENAALAAQIDEGIFARDAQGADKLDLRLKSVGAWFSVAGKTLWPITALAATVLIAVLAGTAWHNLLPYDGLRWIFTLIGLVLVFAIAIMGHGMENAIRERDGPEITKTAIALVIFIALNMIATVSFQVTTIIDKASGRAEITQDIDALRRERNGLEMLTAVPVFETSEQVHKAIEAFKLRSAVNQPGAELPRSIGDAVGDCTNDKSWYVRTYCPTLRDMEGRLEAAKAYEQAKVRMAEIDATIETKRDERPPSAGPLQALQTLLKTNDTTMGYIVPMIIMLLLELFMAYAWYETARASKKARS